MGERDVQGGEQVVLRPLDMDDLTRIHAWHNDSDLYQYFSRPHRWVSRDAVEQWLRTNVAYSNDRVSLAICLAETGEHIGNVYLRSIDWVARHAEVALFIADQAYQSRGYGRAASQLIIAHAFEGLGLLRLYLTVLAENSRAIKAYEKCGFQVEGCLRRHAYKDGQFKDVLCMGLCADRVAP